MFKRTMMVALLAGLVALAFTMSAIAAGSAKVTITGTAKALVAFNGTFDPDVAYASLTVTTTDAAGNVTQDVYDVYGWGGVVLAKADGKKAEVTGVVGEKDGKKTITAASVGVKIIVVEEKPAE